MPASYISFNYKKKPIIIFIKTIKISIQSIIITIPHHHPLAAKGKPRLGKKIFHQRIDRNEIAIRHT